MLYTIKKITRNEKVSPRTNKPYTSVGLQVAEYGETWINGFGNAENAQWKEGDKVELNIVDKEYTAKDGTLKKSKNFESPKKEDKVAKALENLLVILTKHTLLLEELVEAKRKDEKAKIPGTEIDYPMPEDEGLEEDDMANFDPQH